MLPESSAALKGGIRQWFGKLHNARLVERSLKKAISIYINVGSAIIASARIVGLRGLEYHSPVGALPVLNAAQRNSSMS